MDESGSEGESIAFTREGKGNRVTQVHVLNEREIGSGVFGRVYESLVNVEGRNRKFVIKKFSETRNKSAKDSALNAFQNYNRAKEAGLKVFSTYRLGEDGTSILMTNGNSETTVCVGGSDPNSFLEKRGIPRISNIDDVYFTDLAGKLFSQASIAANQGIALYEDAFFYLVDPNSGGLDFVVGDLDMVNTRPIPPEHLLSNNLNSVEDSLLTFIKGNFKNPDKYTTAIGRIRQNLDSRQ